MLSQWIDHISSEDLLSGDGNLYRKSLQWLKKKYRKSLHVLDKLYINQLSQKARVMMRNRKDATYSDRPKPDNAPDYLLINDEQCTAADALNVTNETENSNDFSSEIQLTENDSDLSQ